MWKNRDNPQTEDPLGDQQLLAQPLHHHCVIRGSNNTFRTHSLLGVSLLRCQVLYHKTEVSGIKLYERPIKTQVADMILLQRIYLTDMF